MWSAKDVEACGLRFFSLQEGVNSNHLYLSKSLHNTCSPHPLQHLLFIDFFLMRANREHQGKKGVGQIERVAFKHRHCHV